MMVAFRMKRILRFSFEIESISTLFSSIRYSLSALQGRQRSIEGIEKGKYPEEYFPLCFVEQTTQKTLPVQS